MKYSPSALSFQEYLAQKEAARLSSSKAARKRKCCTSGQYSKPVYHIPPDGVLDLTEQELVYMRSPDIEIPNIGCYAETVGGRCTNPHCLRHGHRVRERQALKHVRYRYWDYDTFSLTLQFGCRLYGGQQLRIAVETFTRLLKQKKYGIGVKFEYVRGTEFSALVPHVHFVLRLPVGFITLEDIAVRVKDCWRMALSAAQVPWLSQRVGCQLVGKTWDDVRTLFRYNRKTNAGSVAYNDAAPVGWGLLSYTHNKWQQETGMTAEEAERSVIAMLGLNEGCTTPQAGHGMPCRRVESWLPQRLSVLCGLNILTAAPKLIGPRAMKKCSPHNTLNGRSQATVRPHCPHPVSGSAIHDTS